MTTLAPGTIFAGDYRIVRPLSAGGMGMVYVAHQLSTGRDRALKLMLGEMATSADLKRRFAQEARIGGEIDSAHIVEVVGAGVDTPSGTPWLAMELLQGEELSTYLQKSGPLPPAVVLELFEQLVHALGAAHDKQIVHRDLKPENLFLEKSRRAGVSFTLKVLDFGIAKLMNQVRTSATGAMGTPLWMAPEQAQMGVNVSPAADVWAMGLIAFRALTGKSFWRSAADPNSSTVMVLREVLMDALPTASARARELGAAPLPAAFDGWFARCVARDPKARFQHARQAFEPLRAALAPNAARPAPAAAPIGTIAAEPLPSPTVAAEPLTLSRSPSAVVIPRAPASVSPAPSRTPLYAGLGAGAAGLVVLAILLSGSSAKDKSASTTPTTERGAPTQTSTTPPPETSPKADGRPHTSQELLAALGAGTPKTFDFGDGTIRLTSEFTDLKRNNFERIARDFSVLIQLWRYASKPSAMAEEKKRLSNVGGAASTLLSGERETANYYLVPYGTENDTMVLVQEPNGYRCEARFRDSTDQHLARSVRSEIVEQLGTWCLSSIAGTGSAAGSAPSSSRAAGPAAGERNSRGSAPPPPAERRPPAAAPPPPPPPPASPAPAPRPSSSVFW